LVGGVSVSLILGGLVGGVSVSLILGGLVGGVSISLILGGLVGGVSIIAKTGLATAQPAIKATRLSFIAIAPSVFVNNDATQAALVWKPVQVKATGRAKSPHRTRPLYD
jgi:predicted lipid-binding transport protein (Tim44 family)